MKKMKKIFTMMFVSLVVVTSLTVPQVSAVVQWVTVKEDIVTPGMYVRKSFHGTPGIKNVDDPQGIRVKITTYSWFDDEWIKFTYDTGKNDLGGYTVDSQSLKTVIYWRLSGFFDGGGSKNYLQFKYKLYYMLGSSKIVVGSSNYVYRADTNFDNTAVFHVLAPDAAAPLGMRVYVEINLTLRAGGGHYYSDFYTGANKIVLNSVSYKTLAYTGGGL